MSTAVGARSPSRVPILLARADREPARSRHTARPRGRHADGRRSHRIDRCVRGVGQGPLALRRERTFGSYLLVLVGSSVAAVLAGTQWSYANAHLGPRPKHGLPSSQLRCDEAGGHERPVHRQAAGERNRISKSCMRRATTSTAVEQLRASSSAARSATRHGMHVRLRQCPSGRP